MYLAGILFPQTARFLPRRNVRRRDLRSYLLAHRKSPPRVVAHGAFASREARGSAEEVRL